MYENEEECSSVLLLCRYNPWGLAITDCDCFSFITGESENDSWESGSHPFPPEEELIREDDQHIVVSASKAGINRVLFLISDERSSESLDFSLGAAQNLYHVRET